MQNEECQLLRYNIDIWVGFFLPEYYWRCGLVFPHECQETAD